MSVDAWEKDKRDLHQLFVESVEEVPDLRAQKKNACLHSKMSLAMLGVRSWDDLKEMIKAKTQTWNDAHPDNLITKDNVTIDHIKPKNAFLHMDEVRTDCNHYTNLQPLPRTVNQSKKNTWGIEDEHYWRDRIFKNQWYVGVYLPRTQKGGEEPSFKDEPDSDRKGDDHKAASKADKKGGGK